MENCIPYGIVGDGCVARHFCRYLSLAGIPFKQWSRKRNKQVSVTDFLTGCRAVLLLIRDDAIADFINSNPELLQMNPVHFSGSIYCKEVPSIHPLMTFGTDLYCLEKYRKIPFISEKGRIGFKDLFPELSNPAFAIDSEKKALYHSLCVLAGNFTVMLWQKAFADFHNRLGLDGKILFPYLEQIFANIKNNPFAALTGPLARDDKKTITMNLNALSSDSYQDVYLAFLKTLNQKEQKNENI